MKKENKVSFLAPFLLLGAFAAWTLLLRYADVRPVGPGGSSVGLAGLNCFFRDLTGTHLWLYTLTDWLSLLPLGLMPGFSLLGLSQWIRRKGLFRVDRSLLLLGVFYLMVLGAYLFFEALALNYRPVLIGGRLEASYPSSTTVLVLCVMGTARMQLKARLRSDRAKRVLLRMLDGFTVFMILGRLVSGVHWFSDIVGGILLSLGLVLLYRAAAGLKEP